MQLLTVFHVNQMPLSALVPNYLMASYVYEHDNESYMDDHAYDRLCQRLDTHFDEIQHPHKHIVERQALSATTGYYINRVDYPQIVIQTGRQLVVAAKLNQLYDFRIEARLLGLKPTPAMYRSEPRAAEYLHIRPHEWNNYTPAQKDGYGEVRALYFTPQPGESEEPVLYMDDHRCIQPRYAKAADLIDKAPLYLGEIVQGMRHDEGIFNIFPDLLDVKVRQAHPDLYKKA